MNNLSATYRDTASEYTVEQQGGLLLEIVGKFADRMQTAQRHVHVLDAATPYTALPQRAEARRGILQM